MSLLNEQIQKQAVNFLEYQKGRALYHRMQATLLSVVRPDYHTVELTGNVRDLSRQYEVTVRLDAGQAVQSSCSCKEYDRVEGLCRHRIAVLFQYGSQSGEEIRIRTSPACRTMLSSYEKKRPFSEKENQKAAVVPAGKKLRMVPKLLCEGRNFRVEFRVGYDRMYVIRDLISFFRSYKNGEALELGKSLIVENGENEYEEASLNLARLACLQLDTYLRHKSAGTSNLAVYAEKIRSLELEESVADEYMELFADEGIECQFENGTSAHMEPVRENPRPEVLIASRGREGAHISIAQGWKAVFGRKGMYLFFEGRIYICTEDYSRDLKPFFSAILHKAYPQIGHMDIGSRDLPAFRRYVLPYLEGYLPVTYDGIDMEEYASPNLTAGFFLDMLQGGVLTLTCEERYGSFSFNPVLTDQVPERILRDKEKERQIHDTLTRYFHYRDVRGMMILEEDEILYEFLTHGIDELRALGDVYMTDAVQRVQVKQAPKLQVGMTFVENMMQLTFDSEGMDRLELSGLLQSYQQRKKYHRFSNGDLVRLEAELSDALHELAEGVLQNTQKQEETRFLLPAWHGMYLDSLLQENGMVKLEESGEFKDMISRMAQARPEEYQVPPSMEHVLHGYQKYGYGWMKTLQSYHFGGILADDMGLGKTIQMIALLLADKKEERTSLIVCPASLIYNWQSEIRTFAPELSCLVISGQANEREKLLENYASYDVLVTSYDLVRRDLQTYLTCHFYYVVLDEAQYIKNYMTMNAKAVKQLHADYRMALTGTPIENRLSELWSIFDFLMPGYLYQYNRFHLLFGQTRDGGKSIEGLRRMVAPFILRRKKKDVLKDLPEKYERVVYSGLEGTQRKLYQAAFLELKEQLSENGPSYSQENRMKVLAQLTRLRQICCDPSLCFEGYHGDSAKLDTCMELILRAVDSEHKVLLFSQFTSMLSIIGDRLKALGIDYLVLTGSTPKEERIELVNRFQTEAVPVFLISLKAGGTGLNLTAADIVIHYDPWWNMAAQNQATDRAHRLGQEKSVTVYRLIAKDTLEESILKLQEEKKQLSEDILSADFSSLASLSETELMGLISPAGE